MGPEDKFDYDNASNVSENTYMEGTQNGKSIWRLTSSTSDGGKFTMDVGRLFRDVFSTVPEAHRKLQQYGFRFEMHGEEIVPVTKK